MNTYNSYKKKTDRYKLIARGIMPSRRRLTLMSPPPIKRTGRGSLYFTTPRKKARFQIQKNPIDPKAKVEFVHTELAQIAGKTLVSYLMTDIPLGAGNEDVFRSGAAITIKGCKIRTGFKNLQGCPMFVNVALLAGKCEVIPVPSAIDSTNFFRNDGSVADQRYLDFTTAARSARQMHYLNINSEKWTVLHHHREILNTSGNGDLISSNANRGGGTNDWMTHEKYVKINKVITYDSASGGSCQTPIWLVMWVSRWDQNTTATAVANSADYWVYGTTYFKD